MKFKSEIIKPFLSDERLAKSLTHETMSRHVMNDNRKLGVAKKVLRKIFIYKIIFYQLIIMISIFYANKIAYTVF